MQQRGTVCLSKLFYSLPKCYKPVRNSGTGLPRMFRVDNGPEFRSFEFMDWCSSRNIQVNYIQPGRPMQNAFIERFNKTYREDVLDAYLFEHLEQVRILSDEWLWTYNREIPHGSINDMTPYEFGQLAVNSGKLAAHKTQ